MTLLKSVSVRTQFIKKALLAVAAFGIAFPSATTAQVPVPLSSSQSASRPSLQSDVLTDGTYLFGQSPTPGQIGSTYAVLSVENNQTVGAFYQPRSSFDCFYGQVLPNQLALNVVDSYQQTVHPYAIALSLDGSLVAGSGAGVSTLEGFHRIDTLSEQDMSMLATCKADFSEAETAH